MLPPIGRTAMILFMAVLLPLRGHRLMQGTVEHLRIIYKAGRNTTIDLALLISKACR